MKIFPRFVGIVALLLVGAVPARATNLAPGGTMSPVPGGTAGSSFTTSGSTILASNTLNYGFTSGNFTYVGTLREEVIKLSSGNLDFLYQFTATGSTPPRGTNPPTSFTLNAFNGVSTDVSQAQTISGPGVTFQKGSTDITSATRSSGPGTSITFDLSAALTSNDSPAYTVIVATQSTVYNSNGTLTLNDYSGSRGGVFQADPAPEPATLLLWGGVFGGMGLVGAIRARRKKAAQPVA